MILGLIITVGILGYIAVGCLTAYLGGRFIYGPTNKDAFAILGGVFWPMVLPLTLSIWIFLKCAAQGERDSTHA